MKIQIMGRKVCLMCKGKTLLGITFKSKKFVDITQQCCILFLSNHICIIRVQNVGQFVVSSKEILFISGFIDCILLAKIICFLIGILLKVPLSIFFQQPIVYICQQAKCHQNFSKIPLGLTSRKK